MLALGKMLARGRTTIPQKLRGELGIEPGDRLSFPVTRPGRVEMRVLPNLTLAEMLERYKIEGPIDEATDRELWEAEAAKDVFGR